MANSLIDRNVFSR